MHKKNKKEELEELHGDYTEIDIRSTHNGYIVEAKKYIDSNTYVPNWSTVTNEVYPNNNKDKYEEFIFKNLPELLEWVGNNMGPTLKQRQFLDALGSEKTPRAKEPYAYNTGSATVAGGTCITQQQLDKVV